MKNLVPIKLVTIIALDALEERLIEDLKACGVRGYTIAEAEGEGMHQRNFTELEGRNVRIEVLAPPPIAHEVMEMLAEKYFDKYSIVAYVNTVEVLRPEKFT